ncbi:MAG: hypothetical protein ABJC24_10145 [Chloroflexota bacterium]
MTARPYAIGPDEYLADGGVKASAASTGGLEEFLADFHAAADWPERDAIAERYGLRFPR